MIQRRLWILTLGLALAILPACYQSDVPLGPPGAAADPELTGRWRCISQESDDDTLSLMTIEPAAAGEYAVTFGEPGEEPDHYRGHGTTLGGATFVSVRELNRGAPAGKWSYVRYRVLGSGVIDMRIVADDLVKAAPTAAAARAAIERNLEDPKLYGSVIACARRAPRALALLSPAAAAAPDNLERVDGFVRAEMARQQIPGVAVGIVKQGAVIKAQGYGLANVEHQVPVRPDTILK